jgi:hypothetical protein
LADEEEDRLDLEELQEARAEYEANPESFISLDELKRRLRVG